MFKSLAYVIKDEAIEDTINGKYEEALKSANEARLMNPELPGIKRLVTLLQVLSADPDTTHYGILGVEETANENEICLAYRKLAVDLNPDTNNFPKASDAFSRISEAMRVLSHDRLKYDDDLAGAREARAIVAEMEAETEAMYSKGFAFDLFDPARVAKFDALQGKDFFGYREALARVVAAREAMIGEYVPVAPERRARFGGYFDGMISSSELQAGFLKEKANFQKEKVAFYKEKATFDALHGRDFPVDREIYARAVSDFEAMFGKDVFVALGCRAPFGVVNTFNGLISSSEFQAAFQKEKDDFQNEKDAFHKEKAAFEALHGRDFLVDCEARARAAAEFEAMFDGMISSSELQAAFEAYDEQPQSTAHHSSQERSVCSSNVVAGRGTKRSNTTQATLNHPEQKKKMDG